MRVKEEGEEDLHMNYRTYKGNKGDNIAYINLVIFQSATRILSYRVIEEKRRMQLINPLYIGGMCTRKIFKMGFNSF